MTQTQIINKTIEKTGVDNQLNVCMEECAELIQAISKVRRYGCIADMRENLIEEIADVRIIISELMWMYGITPDEITGWQNQKINRMQRRLKE